MTNITRRINLLKLVRNKQLICSSHIANFSGDTDNKYKRHNFLKYTALGTGITALIYYKYQESQKKRALLESASQILQQHLIEEKVGTFRDDLPNYSLEDVLKHSEMKTRVWVTYKCGVYDITDFIAQHPGGNQIMMAAGSSLEPFWLLYGIHKTSKIYALLEDMRIGNISEEASKSVLDNMDDPYISDPKRHRVLQAHTQKPFNAEPPPSLLVENFYTPNEIFYVRNHLPVPNIDPETYELEIEIEGEEKILKLSLEDIMKLPRHTISATLMCAGNRRSEMDKVKEVKGLSWGSSSVGNATWTGVRLIDVLKLVGVNDNTRGYCHVHFEGLDADTANNPYTASIPFYKALDKRGDVLLAYEMNGKPIPRDHGFPVRAVVPGTVGARNVKWLGRVIVAKEECDSHWQRKDYKGVSPSANASEIDLSKLPSIQELPVISAICNPGNGESVKVEDGHIAIKGYAWSGGGRKIIRVDVTVNGGKEWYVADFDHQESTEPPHHWSWTLWSAKIPVSLEQKTIEIWAKAIDSSYNSQPDTINNIWNFRGFLNNAYHRVKVNLTA